jgi:hypothetical protein
MFEFSHEANASLHAIHENLKVLVEATINTTSAKVAMSNDPEAFLHKVGKAALGATRAVELFTAAVSESARQTGVFPTVIPRRPQPGSSNVVAMLQAATGNSKIQAAAMRRTRSTAGIDGGAQTSRASFAVRNDSVSMAGGSPLAPAPPQAGGASAFEASRSMARTKTKAEMLATAHGPTERIVTKYSGATDTFEGIVSCGAYMLLEGLVRETMAREATWYAFTEGADEARAIALYSNKPKATAAAKMPLRTGAVGAVLRSGIAINVAPDQPSETNPLALCFPIFTASSRQHPIGAVMLQHKATTEPFSKVDEAAAAHWTLFAARFMTEYGVDLAAHSFDPFRVLLLHTSPHARYVELGLGTTLYGRSGEAKTAGVAAEQKLLNDLMNEAARLLELQAEDADKQAAAEKRKKLSKAKGSEPLGEVDTGLSLAPKGQQLKFRAAGVASYSSRLASSVAQFPPPFRVFHSVHHNHFTAVRGARLSGSGVTLQTQNLMDVAEYVSSLEECWRRTTEDLQGIEQEHVAQMDDFRARKRKLKAAQTRAGDLEKAKDMYQERYEALKVELASICGRPVDDAAFTSSHPGTAGGPTSAGGDGLDGSMRGAGSPSSLPNIRSSRR